MTLRREVASHASGEISALRASGGSNALVDRAGTSRTEAIEEFAAHLRALRASAGNPSFREMSGRSHAISHTTLHEAAQGHRFPSWATAAEFVKACGADPAECRERWAQASRAVRAAGQPALDPTTTPCVAECEPEQLTTEAVDAASAGKPPPGAPTRRTATRSRVVALCAVAAGVLAVVAAVSVAVGANDGRKAGSSPSPSEAGRQLTAADCPLQQANPPAGPPAHAGDASAFISDITLPDCTHVGAGRTVTKVWRLKNVGTVPWVGRSLDRVDLPQDHNQCQTITDVPIGRTEPGGLVDVRVEVTVPTRSGFCFVRFKMVDAAGQVALPASRPVNFQLIID